MPSSKGVQQDVGAALLDREGPAEAGPSERLLSNGYCTRASWRSCILWATVRPHHVGVGVFANFETHPAKGRFVVGLVLIVITQ